MTKIDVKDRKILYQLDLNCRQSNNQIGKKVGLGRDVVAYRIDKLENEGIINNFYAVIDTFKLGYNVFRIYLNFQYVTSDIKQKIIDFFVKNKNSWIVVTEKSEIDLNVVLWVSNIFEFYQFWNLTLDKYGEYFENYAISLYIKADVFKKTYLLQDTNKESNRKLLEMKCGTTSHDIDEIDYKLLNILAEKARSPLINLADELNCSSQTINYRIKKLLKHGIISSFRVDINLSKLGLQRYKVDLYLKNHKLKKTICKYLESKPYLEFMNYTVGWADLEPEFVVKNFDELMEILDELNKNFSGAIKKQSFFITEKFHKIRCIPEK